MSFDEFDTLMWSVCEPDEDIVFGGSMAEVFNKAISLAYKILAEGETDVDTLIGSL